MHALYHLIYIRSIKKKKPSKMRFPQFKKSSTEDRLYTVNYSQGFL